MMDDLMKQKYAPRGKQPGSDTHHTDHTDQTGRPGTILSDGSPIRESL
jgi:hypothetical protein